MDQKSLRSLKQRATDAVEQHADELRDIALYLYHHPEQTYREVLAAARLIEYLEGQGFRVERGIGGLPTAFRATIDSGRPGPTLAFLAGRVSAHRGGGPELLAEHPPELHSVFLEPDRPIELMS